MNRPGLTSPRLGECQRSSASKERGRPSRSSLRLVVQLELVVGQGVAQFVFELVAQLGLLGQPGVEVRQAVPPAALGVVEGQVGLLEQLGGAVLAALLVGDTDARAAEQFVLAHLERLAEGLQQALGEGLGLLAEGALEQDDELVAAEAGEQRLGRRVAAQALGDAAQQQVADVVAEGVVDVLEVVEVEEQQRLRLVLLQALFEAREQLGAVGGAGQRVEVGQVMQAALGLPCGR